MSEATDVERGTKVVVHLKGVDAAEFAEQDKIQGSLLFPVAGLCCISAIRDLRTFFSHFPEIIRRYSNFVSSPILLNESRVNTIEALWTKDPKDISAEQHEEFYKFISHSQDRPKYTLHYKVCPVDANSFRSDHTFRLLGRVASLQTDAPVHIDALLYIPQQKPTLFDIAKEGDVQVALYSRRVLIQSRANNILPRWLRFVKGVVDSEDIPLNLSRELLQKSALLRLPDQLSGVRLRPAFARRTHSAAVV